MGLTPDGKILDRYLDWLGFRTISPSRITRLVRDMASQPFMTNDGMISPHDSPDGAPEAQPARLSDLAELSRLPTSIP